MNVGAQKVDILLSAALGRLRYRVRRRWMVADALADGKLVRVLADWTSP